MTQPPNRKEMFRASKLLRAATGPDIITPGSRLRIARPIDAESLIGRIEGRAARTAGGAQPRSLSASLHKRIGRSSGLWRDDAPKPKTAFDTRQRVVVKIHYFGHGGGGAKALRAHVRYIGRDSAVRAPSLDMLGEAADGRDPSENRPRSLRSVDPDRPERWVYYDADRDSVDGDRLAERWGREDRRHFRIILSPENGGRLGDLREYTRDLMERVEADLGTRLEWVAADHWDTDNPHTHIILRGRREDGRDLEIPRDYVSHGFRNAARDIATERLGPRTRNDERLALQREARAHRPSRLDRLLAGQLDENGQVRLADLHSLTADTTDALKARARELERMGLAQETRRNVLRFSPGWRDTLREMELALDIRKAHVRARAQDRARARNEPGRGDQGESASKAFKHVFGLDR